MLEPTKADELRPTIDHVVLVTRGGNDDFDNLVTTSMARNSAKANFTLDELGWSLVEAGRLEDWDGLLGWFMRQSPSASKDPYIRAWYRATASGLEELNLAQRAGASSQHLKQN